MAKITGKYYAVINGNQKGPFSGSEIEKMIGEREINGSTFVWCEGMSDWTEAAKVGELQSLISLVPPPIKPAAPACDATEENVKAAAPQKTKAPAKKQTDAAQSYTEGNLNILNPFSYHAWTWKKLRNFEKAMTPRRMLRIICRTMVILLYPLWFFSSCLAAPQYGINCCPEKLWDI